MLQRLLSNQLIPGLWKGNRIMKRIFMLIICLFITFMATYAFCAGPRDDGPYLFGNFGFASWGDSRVEGGDHHGRSMTSNRGTVIGGGLGFRAAELRAEGELSYQETELYRIEGHGERYPMGGEVSRLSMMFNGYLDFFNWSSFTPFVGGGIGFSKLRANDVGLESERYRDDSDDDVFTYQLSGGVNFLFSRTISLEGRYSYLVTSDVNFDDVNLEYHNHNFLFGVKYRF